MLLAPHCNDITLEECPLWAERWFFGLCGLWGFIWYAMNTSRHYVQLCVIWLSPDKIMITRICRTDIISMNVINFDLKVFSTFTNYLSVFQTKSIITSSPQCVCGYIFQYISRAFVCFPFHITTPCGLLYCAAWMIYFGKYWTLHQTCACFVTMHKNRPSFMTWLVIFM